MEEYMEDTVSLKIKQTEVPAQVLMYLKKQTGHSLSALQEKIRSRDYLIILRHYRFTSLKTINHMREVLMDSNLSVELYEDGELVDSEYFKNLEETYREDEEEMRERGFFF